MAAFTRCRAIRPAAWVWPTIWAGIGQSQAGIPLVCVPGCPVQPDNFMEVVLYLLNQAAGRHPMIPLDEQLRPTWLFGSTVHEGCDRGGYYEQADFAGPLEAGSRKCIVKLGCWGPVVQCNVGKRGWINGIGGCPNVGGVCIGCTMPGFPDKFMPFLQEPPGAQLSTTAVVMYGKTVRALRASPGLRSIANPNGGTAQAADQQSGTPRIDAVRRRRPALNHEGTRSSPKQQQRRDAPKLVEMSWDPITRIVGSLGIYTKIDFANRRVAECHSTSSIFRGYSMFMKGKDPRDAHFITSRICGICGDNHATCACYAQNMAFRRPAAGVAEWIINLGEAAEYMFDHCLYQDNLVGVDFCEQMVRQTNPQRACPGRKDAGPACRRAWLPHDCRHHAGAQSVRRGVLSRSPADEPADAGNVLPDGRAARPSFDALSRRRRHGSQRAAVQRLSGAAAEIRRVHEAGRAAARRPVRFLLRGPARLRRGRPSGAILLGCWGSFNNPDVCDYRYQTMTRLGPGDVRHAGDRRRWQAGHHRPGRDQPGPADPAGQFVLRRLAEARNVRHARSAGQPDRSAASLESDDPAQAAKTRLQRQIHLGHVAPLARPHSGEMLPLDTGGGPLARLWTTALAGKVDIGYVKATGSSVKIYLPKTVNLPEVEFEWKIPRWSNTLERNRARTYFQAYAAAAALLLRRESPGRGPCRPAANLDRVSRCRRTPSAADSTKRSAACCRITS